MIVERLRRALGEAKVMTEDAARAERRRDYWMLSQLDDLEGRGAPPPLCVVRPASVPDVVAVVDACRESGTPLVPYGLGSGVCGGVRTTADAVLLDLGAMKRVRSIDRGNLLAAFDAGVRGSDAESALEAEGLTLGHYPQSIGVSSVGGWVATRAAGQFSTAYGNVEELLFALEAVLPDGRVIETRPTPRAASGPDLRHLLLGSEGTLGVVTGVTFSVRRIPERRVPSAYLVPTMEVGFELQREILQRGLLPPVLRQYDATEAQRMFPAHARGEDALLLVLCEGATAVADATSSEIGAVARAAGATPAAPEATNEWLERRNHVPTFRQFLENGVVVDTIEVAATWDRITGIYRAALAGLEQVPGILTASAHSSHGYRSGVNLYFTFAAQAGDRKDMRSTYLECWRRVMQATIDGGGGISHHHGIGRLRRDYLPAELGDGGLAALRALKSALDPVGFMNPGVLLPGA